jgi:hypothetical protein
MVSKPFKTSENALNHFNCKRQRELSEYPRYKNTTGKDHTGIFPDLK